MVGLTVGAMAASFSSQASAEPIASAGFYEFIVPANNESALHFSSTQVLPISKTGGYYFDAEVDSDGYMHDFHSSFPVEEYAAVTLPGGYFSAELEIRPASEGWFDAANDTIDMALVARVRFTVPIPASPSATCNTSTFPIDVSTRHYLDVISSSWDDCGTVSGYDAGTGQFCVSGDSFTVPALSPSACGGYGNTINTTLDLGSSTSTLLKLLAIDPVYDP